MFNEVGGSGWFRGDFHVHTPFSRCYLASGVTARDLLVKGKGLDFMVITDHNSFDGYCNLLEHWEPEFPVLFPGVELKGPGGYAGLSLLVILNPVYSPEELESFLRELGLSGAGKGDHDLVLSLALPEVAKVVYKYDGIVLWTKLRTPTGILDGIDERQRKYLMGQRWPVMLADLSGLEEETDYPGVWSSNAHRPGEIGSRSTMVKMADLDFNSLKFALQDPVSRLRTGSAVHTVNYPRVVNLKVQGGFLDGQQFLFNPGLNCVIGPRGAGKTTLLKLLAFALGRPTEGLDILLGEGEVEVAVVDGRGELGIVRRHLGQPPNSFDTWGRPTNLNLGSFGNFFAQGEIETVLLNPQFQLELLDSIWESGQLKSIFDELIKKLGENSAAVEKAEQKAEALQEKLLGKEVLLQRLRELQNIPLGEVQERLLERDRELLDLDRVARVICQNFKLIGQLPYGHDNCREYGILSKAHEATRLAKESLTEIWETAQRDLEQYRAEAEQRYCRLEEEYRTLLGGCSDSRLRELLKERERLQIELVGLEPAEQNLERLQEQLALIKAEREQLLQKWTSLGEEIYQQRALVAEAINAKLEPMINVQVQRCGLTTSYRKFLAEWLSTLGVRVIRVLENKVRPETLLNIVKQGLTERLVELSGLSLTRCLQICGILSSRKAILLLETLYLPDAVQIYLRDGEMAKPGHALSTGQRCTTVLPLLLLTGGGPLVIDQPEDQLDNAYVYSVLVARLKDLKDKRQFIFATHNPNIPVLADAEQNFILESNGQAGKIKAQGYIENDQVKELIQEVMEGGKDAFKQRARCYGQLAP